MTAYLSACTLYDPHLDISSYELMTCHSFLWITSPFDALTKTVYIITFISLHLHIRSHLRIQPRAFHRLRSRKRVARSEYRASIYILSRPSILCLSLERISGGFPEIRFRLSVNNFLTFPKNARLFLRVTGHFRSQLSVSIDNSRLGLLPFVG